MASDKRPRKNRKYVFILAACLIVAAAAIVGYNTLTGRIVHEESILYVKDRTTFDTVLDTLMDGRISNPNRFRTVAKAMKVQDTIKPGRYVLKKGMNARELAGMLRSGNQTPLRITFNNIRTMPELAGRLGSQLMADSLEFLEALTSESTASSYGFRKEEFIGMFIPDTYEVYWTVTPEAFIGRMNREYDKFWNQTRLNKLARTGLTKKEVSSMAAIVDEETVKVDEMPIIAGVYINRIRKGMLLQADPTVKYAVGDFSIRRVLNKHLLADSPYNTYMYKGLPPGPIRMPSPQALDAVLNYREHRYLYFCAKPDFSGYHAFAVDYNDHIKNARAYSSALNRMGIK